MISGLPNQNVKHQGPSNEEGIAIVFLLSPRVQQLILSNMTLGHSHFLYQCNWVFGSSGAVQEP